MSDRFIVVKTKGYNIDKKNDNCCVDDKYAIYDKIDNRIITTDNDKKELKEIAKRANKDN